MSTTNGALQTTDRLIPEGEETEKGTFNIPT